MISSLQKRRILQKDKSKENKLKRNESQDSLYVYNPFATISLIRNKTLYKGFNHSATQQGLLKKKPTLSPITLNNQLATYETKFSNFSSKIRNLLKSEQQNLGKQNTGYYQGMIPCMQKAKSEIFSKPDLVSRQSSQISLSSVPYFIQCLLRKSIMTTEVCMHIHNSIMTFKQFHKLVHRAKVKGVDPKIPVEVANRKTVVFDMDETLVHTNESVVKGYELKVPFKTLQGKSVSGYVSIRPYAKEIIKNISRYFDVIIFTAGSQCYADPIIDHLDPDRCITHRLYRQSCTLINNQFFVKDLRVLGRKLQNVVLVDNAPHSYMMQLSNGIPIINYLHGKDDDQLKKLQGYLMSLNSVQDVRNLNNQTFKLAQYHKYENYHKLIRSLYSLWV